MSGDASTSTLRTVRIKSSHNIPWHIFDVLPDPSKGTWQNLLARAPGVVQDYREAGIAAQRSAIDVLLCYSVLGRAPNEHGDEANEPSFWPPLSSRLHSVDGPPARFCFQNGVSQGKTHLLGAYVIAAFLPAAAKAADAADASWSATKVPTGPAYAVALACGFDAQEQTYALLHEPNEADHAVADEQRKLLGAPSPKEPEAATTDDQYGPPHESSSHLRARMYHGVPAANVAPYPGRSMMLQYVKGQEVLARWQADVKLIEPVPPNNLRPRKTISTKRWTTLFYPAEIVGGHGLEHLTIRYIQATDPDREYTVHKRDVTLPPDKGEPDDAERKRQRKARKRRTLEREERRKQLEQRVAAGTPSPTLAPSALPTEAVSALAAESCPGIDARLGAAWAVASSAPPAPVDESDAKPAPPPTAAAPTRVDEERGARAREAGSGVALEPASKLRRLDDAPLPAGTSQEAATSQLTDAEATSELNQSGTSGILGAANTFDGRQDDGGLQAFAASGTAAKDTPSLPAIEHPTPNFGPGLPGVVRSLGSFSTDDDSAAPPTAAVPPDPPAPPAPASAPVPAPVPPASTPRVEPSTELAEWRSSLGLSTVRVDGKEAPSAQSSSSVASTNVRDRPTIGTALPQQRGQPLRFALGSLHAKKAAKKKAPAYISHAAIDAVTDMVVE
jgi:hypothetical protein